LPGAPVVGARPTLEVSAALESAREVVQSLLLVRSVSLPSSRKRIVSSPTVISSTARPAIDRALLRFLWGAVQEHKLERRAARRAALRPRCPRNRGDVDAKALAIVTQGVIGPDCFREAGGILAAVTEGPPDLAALAAVSRRHGLTPVA
jgi:hypothetical protein